jgi:hypothetical protein
MAEVDLLLERDDELRARLEELKRSNRKILEQHPAGLMTRRIQSELDRQTSRPHLLRSWQMKALAGAAASIVLILILPKSFDALRPRETTSTERLKGQGPQLRLYRKTPSGSEALSDGARVVPGDVIRLAYLAAGHSFGAIVSVDGRGAVTLHVPHRGSQSIPLKNDGKILLDFALELDDAPRWERFYLVAGHTPFDVASVLKAAGQIDIESPVERAEALNLPEGLEQCVVSLRKGTK